MNEGMTDEQLADKAKLLAKLYIDTNKLDDLSPIREVVEHAIIYAYRIGYRSHESAQKLKAEGTWS